MSTKLKLIFPTIVMVCLCCTACDRAAKQVTVEETRGRTAKDKEVKLFATSDERFRDVKPSPVRGDAPGNWLVLPAAQFRELNYRFGESGLGEVYVSLSGGSVADNLNRWVRQFGGEALPAEGLAGLEKIKIAGVEGVVVEAAGNYQSGMGQEARPGYALAGVIAEVGGRILTVKMVGLKSEVEKEKVQLKGFASSLELVKSDTGR